MRSTFFGFVCRFWYFAVDVPTYSFWRLGMHRRRRESHRWRGLLRSGRVVGLREDGDSSTATGLVRLRVQTWVALATANGQACE